MYKVPAAELIEQISVVQKITNILEQFDRSNNLNDQLIVDFGDQKLSVRDIYIAQINIIIGIAEDLFATQTVVFAKEIQNGIDNMSVERALLRSEDLLASMKRDLRSQFVFVIEPELSRFAELDHEMISLFETTFLKAKFDFLEAGKCIAFGRPTAAVFHLMRSIEAPLATLAKLLGIAPSDKATWGDVLSLCRTEIAIRDAGKPRGWKSTSERRFFHEAANSLRNIQIATRDPTFHATKETFTSKEAQLEYENTRRFLLQMGKPQHS
jgi:hypothetical protein